MLKVAEDKKFYFQWHITNRCNLRCSHCYQDKYSGENELSFDEMKGMSDRIFLAMKKWNKKADFSITGGEPFIRKDLFELLDYLDNSNEVCSFDLLSNGTLIDFASLSRLKEFDKLRRVQLSLDGAFPETHDRIRGKGIFDKVMNCIKLLRKSNIDVSIMFTLQRSNKNDIPSILDLALEEDVYGLTVERVVPCGNGREKKDNLLSAQEIKKIFQYISDRADLEYERGNSLRVLKYRTLWVNLDPNRANNSNTPPHKELGAMCSIGLDGLCILPDATVLACRRLNIPIGNLKHDSLFKIWYDSDLLWKIRDKNNLKGKCNNCEFIYKCGGCRSMAYACTGDYLAEDPQCWK